MKVDANGASSILSGSGSYLHFSGITFQGAHNQLQVPAVSVGNSWWLTDCVVQNNDAEGLGVWGDHVRLTRVTAQKNGQIGISGANCTDVIVKDCTSHDNNQGLSSPVWAGKANAVKVNGLWYADASWEAGGGKWYNSDQVTLDDYTAYNNKGPGVIFDWNNTNITVRNSTVYNNGGIQSYEGMGIHIEMNNAGPALIENNLVYGNKGGDIVVRSSKNVTVRNNTIRDGTLLFVDWDRGSDYFIKNVSVTGNTFDDTYILTQSDNWGTSSGSDKKITIDGNHYVNPPGKLFQWADKNYTSISDVRSKLGFEKSGWVG